MMKFVAIVLLFFASTSLAVEVSKYGGSFVIGLDVQRSYLVTPHDLNVQEIYDIKYKTCYAINLGTPFQNTIHQFDAITSDGFLQFEIIHTNGVISLGLQHYQAAFSEDQKKETTKYLEYLKDFWSQHGY